MDGEVLLPELLRLNLTPNEPILPLTVPGGTGKAAAYFSELSTAKEENSEHQLGICWLILGALSSVNCTGETAAHWKSKKILCRSGD